MTEEPTLAQTAAELTASPNSMAGTFSAKRVASRTARYLNEKFPPAQAVAIGLGSLVVYLMCGRLATGASSVGWGAAAASVTSTLLFLQVRLLDDFDTHYSLEEITNATPRGLLAGVGVTTALVAVLNLGPSIVVFALAPTAVMVGASIVLALWCPMRTTKPLTARRPALIALTLGRVPLFDVGPALALVYVCARWEASTRSTISIASASLAVGSVWVLYEIWKVSRNTGRYEGYDNIYRPIAVSWAQQRVIVAVLGLVSVALTIALYKSAGLSIAYLISGCGLGLALAALALRNVHDKRRPWWRGLIFPALMVIGMLVQFAALM
jgi:hypothetical protein